MSAEDALVQSHDNAAAESFCQLLKREHVPCQIYSTRQATRSDVFNYIEMFYNPTGRHSTTSGVSPVEFEQRHSQSWRVSRKAGEIH